MKQTIHTIICTIILLASFAVSAFVVAQSRAKMAETEKEMLDAYASLIQTEAGGVALEALLLISKASLGQGGARDLERFDKRISRLQHDHTFYMQMSHEKIK